MLYNSTTFSKINKTKIMHSNLGASSNGGATSGAAGKRLRTDGMKRTEEECRQMLRLAEVENKELKNSLRYVEI